ncbi:MAG: hypothetical protein KAX72_03745 [Chitinophagales bacterium]|jgi:hypothetical protein|nr:hypothetical protein [Bacteroidota bacterium]MBP8249188.1 hypothetical protein [Chitinophagales bacterium]MBP9879436.1 hypothetical protein [Chitinophagales bacterium]
MKKLPLLLLLALPLLLFNACAVEEEPDLPQGTFSSIFSFMENKKSAPQTFTITSGSESTVIGEKGTILTFSPNSFVFADGTPCTGFITITLLEIQTNADMIYNDVFPISGENILNSGGMYYVAASQGGNTLKLAPGATYYAVIPAQTYDPGMAFYSGATTPTGVDWVLIPPNMAAIPPIDFVQFNDIENTYSIFCDSVGWCNCDYVVGGPTVDCTIKLDSNYTIGFDNAMGFAVLEDAHSVVSLNNPLANTVLINGIGAISMHFLIIAVLDGELYYGLRPVMPEMYATYYMDLQPITEEGLDSLILGLP